MSPSGSGQHGSFLPVYSGFRSAASSASLRFLRAAFSAAFLYCFWVANLFASIPRSSFKASQNLCVLNPFPNLGIICSESLNLLFLNLLCGLLRFWNFQGCIAVYLSRFVLNPVGLSQAFQTLLNFTLSVCPCCQLSDNSDIVSQVFCFVNCFF